VKIIHLEPGSWHRRLSHGLPGFAWQADPNYIRTFEQDIVIGIDQGWTGPGHLSCHRATARILSAGVYLMQFSTSGIAPFFGRHRAA
jgi:hypothetical protein